MKKLLFFTILLAGCGNLNTPQDFRPMIVSAIAISTMTTEASPVDTPSTCDGSGWITHGDGHKTKCPGCAKCQSDGQVSSSKPCGDKCTCVNCDCTNKKECLSKGIPPKEKCGPDCVCEAGKCQCIGRECTETPESALISKPDISLSPDGNIQVCDGIKCSVYYSYENAYKLGKPILVASGVDPKEYPALAERAKKEGKVFAVQMTPTPALKKGVLTFSAPSSVSGCSSCRARR